MTHDPKMVEIVAMALMDTTPAQYAYRDARALLDQIAPMIRDAQREADAQVEHVPSVQPQEDPAIKALVEAASKGPMLGDSMVHWINEIMKMARAIKEEK